MKTRRKLWVVATLAFMLVSPVLRCAGRRGRDVQVVQIAIPAMIRIMGARCTCAIRVRPVRMEAAWPSAARLTACHATRTPGTCSNLCPPGTSCDGNGCCEGGPYFGETYCDPSGSVDNPGGLDFDGETIRAGDPADAPAVVGTTFNSGHEYQELYWDCPPYETTDDLGPVDYSPNTVWSPNSPIYLDTSTPGIYNFNASVYGISSDSDCPYTDTRHVETYTVTVVGVSSVSADDDVVCAGGSVALTANPYPAVDDWPEGSPTWTIDPGSAGSLDSSSGPTVTFTPATGFSGTVTITAHCGTSEQDYTLTVVHITTQTIATTPPDQTRRTVGVAEQVTCTVVPNGESVTWSVSGQGTISSSSGGSTTFTAGDQGGNATVTATTSGGSSCSVTFKVIIPSGLIEENTGSITCQTSPLVVSYTVNMYITPATVSFRGVTFEEGTTTASTTGYFSYQNGLLHVPGSPVQGGDVVSGKGTLLNGDDNLSGGTTGPVYSAGQFIWNIPWYYQVPSDSGSFQFSTVAHTKTLNVAGSNATLTLQKAGSSGSCTQ